MNDNENKINLDLEQFFKDITSPPKIKLEVGELYYDTMAGLCIVTELFEADENKRGFHGCEIGRYGRLRIPSRSFILYDDSRMRFRLATDKDIIEYLSDEMTTFNLGNNGVGDSRILSVNTDGIYISGDEFISLNKDQARKLRELLNREID